MCDIQNNGKIQREFETRSTDDQPTIQWLPVVGSWTFLGVNMHFNEKLFMCDSCNFLVRAYHLLLNSETSFSGCGVISSCNGNVVSFGLSEMKNEVVSFSLKRH